MFRSCNLPVGPGYAGDSDNDCDPETKGGCKEGFVCAVATQSGPFCCKKVCVCRGDLVEGTNVDPDGGTIIPFSCFRAAVRSGRIKPAFSRAWSRPASIRIGSPAYRLEQSTQR